MKKLDNSFNRHGHTYEAYKRDGMVALYRVKSHAGGTLGFEIIKIKISPAVFLKHAGVHVPERESYPSDEEFGVRGWYYPVEQQSAAELKYDEICRGQAQK